MDVPRGTRGGQAPPAPTSSAVYGCLSMTVIICTTYDSDVTSYTLYTEWARKSKLLYSGL